MLLLTDDDITQPALAGITGPRSSRYSGGATKRRPGKIRHSSINHEPITYYGYSTISALCSDFAVKTIIRLFCEVTKKAIAYLGVAPVWIWRSVCYRTRAVAPDRQLNSDHSLLKNGSTFPHRQRRSRQDGRHQRQAQHHPAGVGFGPRLDVARNRGGSSRS